MDTADINRLLNPFLSESLSETQLNSISTYIDLLLRWNQRINLTSVRDPEIIVARHFGESLFAARHLLSRPGAAASSDNPERLLDVGSGAGFPGLPMKVWSPHSPITLIESNHKKVAFLREVVRALTLTSIDVFSGRAEDYPASSATLVTMRAVERFSVVLTAAARLLAPGGRLALLIGSSQVADAKSILPTCDWTSPYPVPQSTSRVLLVGIVR